MVNQNIKCVVFLAVNYINNIGHINLILDRWTSDKKVWADNKVWAGEQLHNGIIFFLRPNL